jgi:hypothetical protein
LLAGAVQVNNAPVAVTFDTDTAPGAAGAVTDGTVVVVVGATVVVVVGGTVVVVVDVVVVDVVDVVVVDVVDVVVVVVVGSTATAQLIVSRTELDVTVIR